MGKQAEWMNSDPGSGMLSVQPLTKVEFARLSDMIRKHAGINLHEGKQELVKARLNKRLRELGMHSYQEYLDFLQHDSSGDEFIVMLNSISTNVTNFFRESDHFTFLTKTYFPQLRASKTGLHTLRFWSAGCSSGEEPYTLGIVLKEEWAGLDQWDVKILATDLSTKVLNNAKQGIYEAAKLSDVPPALLKRYFTPLPGTGGTQQFQVKDEVRRLVHFARLNLLDTWPMRGPFDLIFCRNVMIYFEKKLREQLVQRYWELLAPNGILFIGHSESLAGIEHKFQYVAPTVYRK